MKKKNYRKRYERITKSELFKETYHNKSLGMDEKTAEELREILSFIDYEKEK